MIWSKYFPIRMSYLSDLLRSHVPILGRTGAEEQWNYDMTRGFPRSIGVADDAVGSVSLKGCTTLQW
jgi:hypothetical protein